MGFRQGSGKKTAPSRINQGRAKENPLEFLAKVILFMTKQVP